MKKTKEIEVWVHENFQSNKLHPALYALEFDSFNGFTVKAKLIIELPEKYVTITESDYQKIWDHTRSYGHFIEYKNELFGGENK